MPAVTVSQTGMAKLAWASPRALQVSGSEPNASSKPNSDVEGMLEFYEDGVYGSPPRRKTRISSRRIIDEVYDYKGEYENPKFTNIEMPLGLKWKEEVGMEKPTSGTSSTEIYNEALATALKKRIGQFKPIESNSELVFTRSEWDEFKELKLTPDSYIKVITCPSI